MAQARGTDAQATWAEHLSQAGYWEALRRHLATQNDLTQVEVARQFGVSRHGIWNALHKMGWTRKKTDERQRAQPAAPTTMSAASPLPSLVAMGMRPRDSAWTA